MRCGVGQPPEDILAIEGLLKLSPSGMMEFLKSPAHFHAKYVAKKVQKTTKAMETGNKVHMAVLETELFHSRFVKEPRQEDFKNVLCTADDWKAICKVMGLKSSGAKAEIKARVIEADPKMKDLDWDVIFENHCQGRSPISPDEFENIQSVMESVNNNSKLKSLFARPAIKEQFCWIYDSELNILFRFKMDLCDETGLVVDVKQCPESSPRAFSRKLYHEKLFVQAAMYFDFSEVLHQHCTDMKWPKPRSFLFAAYEFASPHNWMAYNVDSGTLDAGTQLYRKAIMRLIQCRHKGHWPGYSDKIETLSLPHYAWRELDEDAEGELDV